MLGISATCALIERCVVCAGITAAEKGVVPAHKRGGVSPRGQPSQKRGGVTPRESGPKENIKTQEKEPECHEDVKDAGAADEERAHDPASSVSVRNRGDSVMSAAAPFTPVSTRNVKDSVESDADGSEADGSEPDTPVNTAAPTQRAEQKPMQNDEQAEGTAEVVDPVALNQFKGLLMSATMGDDDDSDADGSDDAKEKAATPSECLAYRRHVH